jgi:hypothetical protein
MILRAPAPPIHEAVLPTGLDDPSTGGCFDHVNPAIVVNANQHGHHLPQQEVSGWWSSPTDTNVEAINNPMSHLAAIN